MRSVFRMKIIMEDQYISMIKGDTLSFGIELMDEHGETFTQELETAYFTCKSNKTDEAFLFQKTLGNGITKVDDGIYTVRVAPSDTKDAEAGKYYYDLQIGANGDIFTVLHGVLELEQDVTN